MRNSRDRPMTENKVKVWCNLNHNHIEEARRECEKEEGQLVSEYVMPVFEAGEWLGTTLQEAGATYQERKDACFAMGQRAFMAGPNKAYHIAAECYNRWVEGHKDQPGLPLAKDLCTEDL